MGDEAKIVNIEEDGEEGQDVRGWEGEVWVVALDGVNEVRDVESPEEGGEATARAAVRKKGCIQVRDTEREREREMRAVTRPCGPAFPRDQA